MVCLYCWAFQSKQGMSVSQGMGEHDRGFARDVVHGMLDPLPAVCMSCCPTVKVSVEDVEYKRVYKRDALKEAVKAEAYPPSITVKVLQNKVPEGLINQKFIHLFISGTTSGGLTFPVEVVEEKEREF